MTYREAIIIVFWLLAALVFMRVVLWLVGVFSTGSHPKVHRHVVELAENETPAAPISSALDVYEAPVERTKDDGVIRNVDVLTEDETKRPRVGYLWYSILPSDPDLRELAKERLERGWKYDHKQIGLHGMRYFAKGLPSLPPTPQPREH